MAIRTPARTFIRIAAFAAALGAVAAAASSSPPRSRRLPLVAPVLDAFNGKWHHPSYSLSGSVDSVRVGSQVRIFRNGSVVDSAVDHMSEDW